MIHILQPEIPIYRDAFFKKLIEEYTSDIQIFASPGKLGLLTEESDKSLYTEIGSYLRFPFGVIYQCGVPYRNFQKNDTIVVSGNIREVSTLLVFIYCKIIGAKIIWWSHYRSANGSSLGLFIRKFFLKFSTACLFYTSLEVDTYKLQIFKNKNCFALNNGIDTSQISKHRASYTAEKRHGIVFIGRLSQKAAVHKLIEALPYINEDIKVEIIGDGYELVRLKMLAAKLKVDQRIFWHGAIIDNKELARILNSKKLFVYPGSVGLSLLHSLSFGIPAVIHNKANDHMPEYAAFLSAEVGLSFVKDDVQSLAKKINLLYFSHSDLNRMSHNSIELTEKTFNTDDMAKRFIKMLQHLQSE